MKPFAGRTVLITGAAGGIGRVLCQLFADKGASIAALDRDSAVEDVAQSLIAGGAKAAACLADIGSVSEVQNAICTLRNALGPITLLINNAGFSSAGNLECTSADNWHRDINGNLNGAFHCTSEVLKDMVASRTGAIVNVGSVNGITALGDPAYSAAKAGLISYTRSVAMEYGCYGIRANVVCPGTVRTPIWNHRIEKNPAILDELKKWYPLRRVADPIDVANAVAFLASDDAGAITGAALPVDCGLTAGNIVMTRELTLEEFS